MLMEEILGKYNYWISAVLMLIGFYTMISKKNFVKKIIGMNIFQTAIILFYISIADVENGVAPILLEEGLGHADTAAEVIYVNPLPHVLMLTAIVVGVSTTAVALSLIMKIHKEYGTFEEDDILEVLEVH